MAGVAGSANFEHLGDAVQKLLIKLEGKGGKIAEEDLELLQHISVRQLAKIYEMMGEEEEDPEAQLARLKEMAEKTKAAKEKKREREEKPKDGGDEDSKAADPSAGDTKAAPPATPEQRRRKTEDSVEQEAAIAIQRVTRGHQSRKSSMSKEGEVEAKEGGEDQAPPVSPTHKSEASRDYSKGSKHSSRSGRKSSAAGSDKEGSKRSRSGSKSSQRSGISNSYSADSDKASPEASPEAQPTTDRAPSPAPSPQAQPRHPLVREILRMPIDNVLRKYPRLSDFIDVEDVRDDWGLHAPPSLRQTLSELARGNSEAFYLVSPGDRVTVASGHGTTNQGDEGRRHWGKYDGRDGLVQELYNNGVWARVMLTGGTLAQFRTDWLIRHDTSNKLMPLKPRPSGQSSLVDPLEALPSTNVRHPLSTGALRGLQKQTKLLNHLKEKQKESIARKEEEERLRWERERDRPRYVEKLERSDSDRQLGRTLAALHAASHAEEPGWKTAPLPPTYPGLPGCNISRVRNVEMDRTAPIHPPPRPHRAVRLHGLTIEMRSPGPSYYPDVNAVKPGPKGVTIREAQVVQDRLVWGGVNHLKGGRVRGIDSAGPLYHPTSSWSKGTARVVPRVRPKALKYSTSPGPADYYADTAANRLRPRVTSVAISRGREERHQKVDEEAAMRPPSYVPMSGANPIVSEGTMLKKVAGTTGVTWDDTEVGAEVWAIPQELRSVGLSRYCRCTVAGVTDKEVRVSWAPRDAVRNELPNDSTLSKRYWLDQKGACPRIEAVNRPQRFVDRLSEFERVTHNSVMSGVGVGDAFSRKPHAIQVEDKKHDDDVRLEWAQAVVDEEDLPAPTTPHRPDNSGIGTFGTADRLNKVADNEVPGPGQYTLGLAHSTGVKTLEGGRLSRGNLGKRGETPPRPEDPDPHTYRPVYSLTRPGSPSALCYLTA
eukprot:Hpha_TRINITY_DN9181_c0_g1::TRINITY_DN9181_c0_g1_i1::g.94613::m.94613